jgi:hypothetical protein
MIRTLAIRFLVWFVIRIDPRGAVAVAWSGRTGK